MDSWIFPLTILPGIGLIIMSTTNWSVALGGEIERLLNNDNCSRTIVKKKIKQLSLLNSALVALYISAAVCALGGFLGATFNYLDSSMEARTTVTIITSTGIAFLLTATVMLIIYAFRAVNIKRQQFLERLPE